MGYSGRYHAASLAAVFLALAIGILIGVGLGHNVLSGAQKDLEQSLKSDLADTHDRNQALQAELNQERDFSTQAYPALVGNLLSGKRIAVIALGGLPDAIRSDIEAVAGTSSPTAAVLGEVVVLREPPDLHALAAAARHTPWSTAARDPDALSRLARSFGRSLVTGRQPLGRFRDTLLSGISRRAGRIDAAIVVRTHPTDLGPAQSAATESVEAGIMAGLSQAGGIPVVGVERSDTDPSSISVYNSSGLTATVDSTDLVSGRVALAYALAGAQGNFGVKASADRLLPRLDRPAAALPASGSR
ncbi:MAG: copper transporter [Solirubrobacterales bacterium]